MKGLLWKNLWQTAVAVGFLLLVWLIAYFAKGNELVVPSFSACLRETGRLLGESAFWLGFLRSLLRAVVAFLLSFACALAFACLAYAFASFARLFAPIVSAMRSLPVLAILLILLSLFDAGKAPVAVAFLSLFPMLYTGILAAVSGVDEELIEMARAYGASHFKRATKVYLPLSAPAILRECGSAISFSLKLVVSAEVLANTAKSLGGMMQEARIYGEMPSLFALVGVTFLTGLLLETFFSVLTYFVEKRVKGE